ncbi:MAG: hypothetical protein JXA36_01325 [Coriobacteriia bacterium]|nr:hypothetical protein [Coriobacteriia bacterium]
MSELPETVAEARRLDELYRTKADAEIAAAEALVQAEGAVRGQGDVLAEVALVKGEPGPADLEAGRALAGEDGVAVGKALDALGLPESRYAFCTRPGKASDGDALARVRLLVEAIDPLTVILLDSRASADVAAAYGSESPEPGVVGRIGGRKVLAVEDFEKSLGDEASKRRVWKQLRTLAREDRT